MRGGKREGAGRPLTPPLLKKAPISLKLPRWLIEWMDDQTESRAVLIEDALKRRHKINPPDEAQREIDPKLSNNPAQSGLLRHSE